MMVSLDACAMNLEPFTRHGSECALCTFICICLLGEGVCGCVGG